MKNRIADMFRTGPSYFCVTVVALSVSAAPHLIVVLFVKPMRYKQTSSLHRWIACHTLQVYPGLSWYICIFLTQYRLYSLGQLDYLSILYRSLAMLKSLIKIFVQSPTA